MVRFEFVDKFSVLAIWLFEEVKLGGVCANGSIVAGLNFNATHDARAIAHVSWPGNDLLLCNSICKRVAAQSDVKSCVLNTPISLENGNCPLYYSKSLQSLTTATLIRFSKSMNVLAGDRSKVVDEM